MISVWMGHMAAVPWGSRPWSEVTGSHLNKTDLRFFSQLLWTKFSLCLPITSAGSGHIFSIPHGKTEVIAVKHMQGQASCWGELTQCTATKARVLWHHPATLSLQKQWPGNLSSRRTTGACCPPCPGKDWSSSFQPQHNRAMLCHTGTDFCENCQTDDSASNF